MSSNLAFDKNNKAELGGKKNDILVMDVQVVERYKAKVEKKRENGAKSRGQVSYLPCPHGVLSQNSGKEHRI